MAESRAVWKWPIADPMAMPAGARIVHVGQQHGVPTVWALVDPAAPRVARRVEVVGTGYKFAAGEYVGTVLMPNGLVWHVVDLGEGGGRRG